MDVSNGLISRGEVEFIEFPKEMGPDLRWVCDSQDLELLIRRWAIHRFQKRNLVFNFPREQYAKLDRGETPEAINARWFTLSASAYSNPATETVSGESMRLETTTLAVDPSNPKNSVIRFILDAGQFVGSWSTAILIGGATATSTPGTGKIVAAVNSVTDDLGNPLARTGSTIHLVNWKLKHLDSSEV